MANQFYRDRVRTLIARAMQDFRDIERIDHSGFKGRIRELAVSNIIKPLLYEHLAIGQGKVIDYIGGQSAQIDCVLYSTRNLPPVLYSENEGIFPVDSVLFAIEIKSILNSTRLREALENSASLWPLQYSTGLYSERNGRREPAIVPLRPVLFAFSSDLTRDGKSELERYCELDPHVPPASPTISMICVIGRGFWWYNYEPRPGKWIFHPPTEALDEVIDFMAFLSLLARGIQLARPAPNLQPYLVNPSVNEDGLVTRT